MPKEMMTHPEADAYWYHYGYVQVGSDRSEVIEIEPDPLRPNFNPMEDDTQFLRRMIDCLEF